MRGRTNLDVVIKPLAILCMTLCAAGAVAAIFVILVRVPAISSTKLEVLFGTLQGVTVGLLFAVAALLINLTYLVWRASRAPHASLGADEGMSAGQSN